MRNAKSNRCGKTGNLKKMCKERKKTEGKVSSPTGSGKDNGKGGKNRNNDTYYCTENQAAVIATKCAATAVRLATGV